VSPATVCALGLACLAGLAGGASARPCDILCETNRARREHGLRPLRWVTSAGPRRKAYAIIRCDQWVHNPCGRFQWGSWYCEVIGTGLRNHRAVVRAWLRSRPHRACLLSPQVSGFTAYYAGPRHSDLWVAHLR
jgi:hypothetical protein